MFVGGLACMAAHGATFQPEPPQYTARVVTAQSAATRDEGAVYEIPYFPAAANPRGWQGFVRVANHSDVDGEVSIRAFDDGGSDFGTLALAVDAGGTVHFNSADLEDGNASKGLDGGTGRPGQGDWRLELTSELRIEAMSYVRTSDGLLTAMHDIAPEAGGDGNTYRVVTFNPGSNRAQESFLRLVSPGAAAASVTIRGVDDRGAAGGPVRVSIPARAARTVSAVDLEEGGTGLDGSLGDGGGKWRLEVESDAPVRVMSLLASPTGHLTNLSTVPAPTAGQAAPAAPEVSIESPTEVDVVWVADLEAGSSSWDVQLKYRGDDEWRIASGCVEFAPDAGGRYPLTAKVGVDADLAAGRVLQARYRDRGEPFCADDAEAPGPWSGVGEATVPDDNGAAASHCRPDGTVQPGGRCDIYGTDDHFEVESSGRGCLYASFTTCSGSGISLRTTGLTFVASRNADRSWTVEDVDPAPGGSTDAWGAISYDFYVSQSCPGLAAGIALDEATEEEAADAARRACRDDGGSASECRDETTPFEGCGALAYGRTSRGCSTYLVFGNNPAAGRAAAESEALSNCRDDGSTGCRIWTDGSGGRISGCNGGTADSAFSGRDRTTTTVQSKQGTGR